MRFVRRPEQVEAVQWFAHGGHEMVESLQNIEWVTTDRLCTACGKKLLEHGWIKTLAAFNDEHIVCPGDWIVTDVFGNVFSRKPEAFAQMYDKAECFAGIDLGAPVEQADA